MKNFLKTGIILIVLALLAGCASIGGKSMRGSRGQAALEGVQEREETAVQAGNPGQKILKTGEKLAFTQKKIIIGSCWDFINAVYNEAGFPENKRTSVFKGSSAGPYADPDTLKPGDWVMHINLEFNNVEHSSIFVRWVDRGKRIAKVLDYAGQNKAQPGGYDEHTYKKIFGIVRAGEK